MYFQRKGKRNEKLEHFINVWQTGSIESVYREGLWSN